MKREQEPNAWATRTPSWWIVCPLPTLHCVWCFCTWQLQGHYVHLGISKRLHANESILCRVCMRNNYVDTKHIEDKEYVPTASILYGVLCGTTMRTLNTVKTWNPCPLSVFCAVLLCGTNMWTLNTVKTKNPCPLSVFYAVLWDNYVDTTHTVNRQPVPTVSVLCGVLCGITLWTLLTQLIESTCPLSVFCVVFYVGQLCGHYPHSE